jgi:2-octaprenyl-6-methoxyphenol hydroxylase
MPDSTSPQTVPLLRTDVAIVGGGLVGAALAVALAHHGVRVAVIDRQDPAAMVSEAFDGRASAVALSSQKMLAAIGVWPRVSASGPIREIRVSDAGSLLFLHYDHADIGDEPLGFMAENRVLRQALATALRDQAAHVTRIAPAVVTGVTQDADHARLSLADGRQIAAAVVVAADGRGSAVRSLAGIPVTQWTYPQVAIVATIGHARPHDAIAHEHFLPAGPFAILPLPDDVDEAGAPVHRSSLVWTERADAAPSYLAMTDADFLAAIAERVGGFLGSLTLIGPRFSHPLGLQFAARYVKKRLVLAGDAAHAIHPIAGQGVNLGWRDVAALAEILVEAHRLGLDLAHPAGLERYERWRRADNLLMAGVTDVLNRLFSNDVPPVRLARDLGLGIVNRLPPVKAFLMRHAMGMVGELPRLMRGEAL